MESWLDWTFLNYASEWVSGRKTDIASLLTKYKFEGERNAPKSGILNQAKRPRLEHDPTERAHKIFQNLQDRYKQYRKMILDHADDMSASVSKEEFEQRIIKSGFVAQKSLCEYVTGKPKRWNKYSFKIDWLRANDEVKPEHICNDKRNKREFRIWKGLTRLLLTQYTTKQEIPDDLKNQCEACGQTCKGQAGISSHITAAKNTSCLKHYGEIWRQDKNANPHHDACYAFYPSGIPTCRYPKTYDKWCIVCREGSGFCPQTNRKDVKKKQIAATVRKGYLTKHGQTFLTHEPVPKGAKECLNPKKVKSCKYPNEQLW